MLQIGKVNSLKIRGTQPDGIHLDAGGAGDIILPPKSVPATSQVGDEVEVFVYVDKENKLQATVQKPSAMVGEFACLQVVADSSAGSFLHWGMENDLLVPKGEQQHRMETGQSYVVFILLSDKTNRIIASSRLDNFTSKDAPAYKEGEEVDLMLCEQTDLGYSALINKSHMGMIYTSEVFQKLEVGQQLKGYIKKIREDQKIDLILQQPGYKGVDDIAQAILTLIQESGGTVAVTDKSPPEEIYALFSVSKKVFKKAIGSLYKKRLITIGPDGISLVSACP